MLDQSFWIMVMYRKNYFQVNSPQYFHTGKCIRLIWWYLCVLPVLHRPEVVDIGVNTVYKNMPYA